MFGLIKYATFFSLALLLNYQGDGLIQDSQRVVGSEITFDFVSKEVQGSIEGFQTETLYDPDNLEKSVFKGSVAVETINTGNFLRDWSLKKGKYFNAEDYPLITFESFAIKAGRSGFTVHGELNIKGISKAISINFKEENSKLIGDFSIYSSDFGIRIKNDREDNLVKVHLELVLSE